MKRKEHLINYLTHNLIRELGRLLFISLFLSVGVISLESCTKYSGTPDEQLVQAVKAGDLKGIENLLKKGADPNTRVDEEWTVLHASYYGKKPEIFKVLAEAGANPDVCDSSLKTLLSLAIMDEKKEYVEILIENGADVNSVNRDSLKSTPLMLAADTNQLELIQELLDKGAYIDAKDSYGYSAVGFAVAKENLESLKLLTEAGADLSYTGNDNNNLLDHAIRSGNKDIISYLESKGLKPTHREKI